ncbi:MAG: nucleotidyltransferase family protein [bacterium]|nr:nucleotidyltransferase family protein [bacterium]
MDFKKVLGMLLDDFEEHQIEYALIGGFALGVLGIARNTIDLDLLAHKKDLEAIDLILSSHLYRLKYRSENVSQYISDLKPLGTIDLLHAFRERSLAMLTRSESITIFDGLYEVKVLRPGDIIGLKLQAMFNNPDRRTLDRSDIELLLTHFHESIDWGLLEDYFQLFQQHTLFEELQAKYGTLK